MVWNFPIIIGKKYYNNDTIINDIGTVIVLNKNGDILTIVFLIISMVLMLIGTLLLVGKTSDNEIKIKAKISFLTMRNQPYQIEKNLVFY